ncbi:hypothetical protein CEV32_0348 [Brucella rhizosphaerae]|uniref:Uncharacterized protein n=1 Tax=Brucella rhizosphaerae TaxID=571254 RepID=A0A256FHP1_9HYPH|nr:hypothetical protein CEV32_0348 [Brucella rhizosphaerae]
MLEKSAIKATCTALLIQFFPLPALQGECFVKTDIRIKMVN